MWWMVAAMAAKTVLGQSAQVDVSKARNKAVIQQTAKQLNDIALQRAQSMDWTEVFLFTIQQLKLPAHSQVGLEAAASGTVGVFVNDAVRTVNTASWRPEASVRVRTATYDEAFRLTTDKSRTIRLAVMDMEDPYDNMFNSLLSVGRSAVGKYAVNAASSRDSGVSSPGSGAAATKCTAASYDSLGSRGNTSVPTW
ncbi:internal virion protein [Klebsiella virus 2019KP1]|nr:internal virion protein [Klebsiella virus 2019KP1]